MKGNKRFLFVLLAFAAGLTSAYAYDFEADGLYYNINSGTTTVTVTYPGSSSGSAWTNFTKPIGELVIPSTVTYDETEYTVTVIGASAFRQCSGLTSVTLPASLTTIDQYAFYNCTSMGNINIPSNVTTIGKNAFYQCDAFTEVVIPNNVTNLGNYAFYGCDAVTTLSIGTGVTVLPDYVFAFMESITSVSIPNNITQIKQHAFDNCSKLATITNATNVQTIGVQTFANCKLESVSFENVETIGNNAFDGCKVLASVNFPKVKTLETQVFNKCDALTSISLPNTLNNVSGAIFTNCTNSVSITVAEGGTYKNDENNSCILTADGTTLVAGCNNTVIPDDITAIGVKAFYQVTGITEVTIPASVTSIGNYAFGGAMGLTKVTMKSDTPCSLGTKVFTTGNMSSALISGLTIYVPAASVSAYKNDNGAKANDHWSTYESIIKGWMQKSVAGYGSGYEAVSDHWCLIASPIVAEEGIDPASVGNLTTGNFDLYRLNEGGVVMQEWENYENAAHTDDFKLENGQGYLYANEDDVELTFFGDFNTETTKEVTLHKTEGSKIPGWNLVGNPFTVDAYISRSHYVLNEDGSELEPATPGENAIAPFSGILVQADNDGDILTFSTTPLSESVAQGNFSIALSQQLSERGASVIDNAIVSFDERNRLGKFALNNNRAKVYIPQNGKDYAIAVATRESELPLNFKATENGTYTLSFSANGVEIGYFHLIDNMTGANIDLNVTPSYTFTAKTTDYASRFRIVFKTNDIEESGDTTSTALFAFIDAAGNIVVTEATQDATLQIVDLTGRIIRIANGIDTVSTTGMPAGVYVLRLINGNDVKTQKMVIE